MQCRGALRRPLRDIIKSIGVGPPAKSVRQHYPHHHHHTIVASSPASPGLLSPRVFCENSHQPPSLPDAFDPVRQGSSAVKPSHPVANGQAKHTKEEEKDASQLAHKSSSTSVDDHVALHEGVLPTENPHNLYENDHGDFESNERDLSTKYLVDLAKWKAPRQYYRTIQGDKKFKARKALSRDLRQQQRHQYRGMRDWRDILHKLHKHTTSGPGTYGRNFETVALPHGVSAVFRDNAGTAVLEIMQRTGCHVQTVANHSGSFSEVVLFGSENEITMAMRILPGYVVVTSDDDTNVSQYLADYMLKRDTKNNHDLRPDPPPTHGHDHLQADLASGEDVTAQLQSSLDDITAPPIRSYWSNDPYAMRPPSPRLLPQQEITSTLKLTAFVSDLVSLPPRLLRRHEGSQSRPRDSNRNIDSVTRTLVTLFADPSISKFAANESVDRALQFLTLHGKFPEIREIKEMLESNGFSFTATNFDVLLEAAAKSSDLHNFRHLLNTMLRNDIKPTPLTWARFHNLMSRRHPRKASIVLEAMRRKGLLASNAALVLVTHDAVHRDVKSLVRRNGTLLEFLALYDRRFQESFDRPDFNWLSRDVMNKIAHTFLEAGRTQDAYNILAEFRKRGHNPHVDTGTLSIFLAPAVKASHTADLAVSILHHFQIGHPGAVIPDQAIYDMLMIVAYRDCCFNMLRVVWRYACAAGHVSAKMKCIIMKSLHGFSPPANTRDGLMSCWGGKFAVGMRDSSSIGQTAIEANPSLPAPSLQPLLEHDTQLQQGTVHQTPQKEFPGGASTSVAPVKAPQDILELDLQEVERLKPTRPFSEVIDEAWRKDIAWRQLGIGLPSGLRKLSAHKMFAHMMKDGIKVPMEPGSFASLMRTREVPWVLEKFNRDLKLTNAHEKLEKLEKLENRKVNACVHSDSAEDVDKEFYST